MGVGISTSIPGLEVIDSTGEKRRLEHYSQFREGDSFYRSNFLNLILSASGTEYTCAERDHSRILVKRVRFTIPDDLEFASLLHPSEVIGDVIYAPNSELGQADRMKYHELSAQLAEAEERWR